MTIFILEIFVAVEEVLKGEKILSNCKKKIVNTAISSSHTNSSYVSNRFITYFDTFVNSKAERSSLGQLALNILILVFLFQMIKSYWVRVSRSLMIRACGYKKNQ